MYRKTLLQTIHLSSALVLAAALLVAPVGAIEHDHGKAAESRNYDARIDHNNSLAGIQPDAIQLQALDALRAEIPELGVTFDETTGVTRTVYNRVGYLTDGLDASRNPMDTALDYLTAQLPALGISAADLEGFEVTDNVFTRVTGASHIYLRQVHEGLPVYNGQLHINVNRDGRLISVNNAFVPQLASAVNGAEPTLGAVDAVLSAARHLEVDLAAAPAILADGVGPRQVTRLSGEGLSLDAIEAQLMWLPVRAGDVRLVWNFQIQTLDSQHWFDMTVDAHSGEVLTRFDWTNSGTYRVYEEPVESPIHTTPLPPADARSLVVNPENGTASPSGWFGGGVMDGNNVHACVDANANNSCDTPQVSCSGTTCDFPINLSAAPSVSAAAAVTNLFYWNNIIHDVQYQYGFDEPGGNFQENNFGNGGAGSDSVNADAQDGSGNCNANFATPTDGGNPRMQMFTCTLGSPARDGDYDNGVIAHEYGHGISIRQVGGPGNSSCLNNLQQAGEGWSDWWALWYTADANDTGPQARGVGSYLFALPANGGTIRDLPYSTDNSVNNWTYESISGASIPHGVGSRWAQAIWEVNWALIDQYGFSANKYNATGGAGNQRANLYINEGLKNTACSPTFVANRDGIIQAAIDNFGGADVCLLWEAFAAFGLGTDAVSGGSNSTNPTNGFSVPPECTGGGGGNLQAGNVTSDENIRTVSLTGFTTPRVVTGPPSFAGSQPTPVRVRNVTGSSFQHDIPEWDYLDNLHANETLGYLALENGAQTLGSLDAEAGSVNINQNWTTVNFSQSFSSAPVVVAQVASFNGSQGVTNRIRNVTANSFEIQLEEEEANDGTHNVERVDWIAIETGSTTVGGRSLVVGRTGNSVTDAWFTINYSSVSGPTFIADMQTTDGGDTAALRHRNLGSTSVQVKVEEEQSLNTEVAHTTEVIGYILIGN